MKKMIKISSVFTNYHKSNNSVGSLLPWFEQLNNDLIINGFLKTSNLNNIDINIDALNILKDELSIGPLTEVINTYDFNAFYFNSPLSNIELNYTINDNSNIGIIFTLDSYKKIRIRNL